MPETELGVTERQESPKRLLREFALAIGTYLLGGKWFIRKGDLPKGGHRVPVGFAGVGVATAADPSVDRYIIEQLEAAGIRHVRLDFTYGDAAGPAGRFLEALLSRSFSVMLHLVQPASAARQMPSESAQLEWRQFLSATLERFGGRAEIVEIGSTINRKRWAGYSLAGFLAAWQIAHCEVRRRGLILAGPSVTDFEPPFNIGFLSLLRRRGLLPDIHTDNLFSERCTEPERYDHKVLGRQLAGFLRVNLIRKARILQKIGADFGVPRLMSPSAFWTLPRIERVLPDSEQKQADYLARYMLLCAASGVLERAWWGPLICHREGLIDDGVPGYPALERITHYAEVGGDLSLYRVRPSLATLSAFSRLIPGCRYEGRLNSSAALEIHAFRSEKQLIHAVWTINGKAAALVDIYADIDLHEAGMLSRDGESCDDFRPSLVGESPLYLTWPATRSVAVAPSADVLKGLAVHWHVAAKHHVFFRDKGWQGVILAGDNAEAKTLIDHLHPDRIGEPPADKILRNARNVIWSISDPRSETRKLVVKKPVRIAAHKRILDRLKPSKAARSWSGTGELLRRGVSAAPSVAYFERRCHGDLTANYYVCEHIEADCSAREMVAAFSAPSDLFFGVSENDAFAQLSNFLLRMHAGGVLFRDLSGGNILIRRIGEKHLQFSLIDTGRLRAYNKPLSVADRVADLVRICNKMSPEPRERFVAHYMKGLGGRLSWWYRLSFGRYDAKVALKRLVGRKRLRKVVRWYKKGH